MSSDVAVIIDDSATGRKILERLTVSLGGVVTRGFAEVEAALSFCRQCRPGLVVVGEPIGGAPAAVVIRRLQALTRGVGIPVMVVAAADDREAIESARDAGAADHVTVPVDHREFLLRARHLLLRRDDARQAPDPTSGLDDSRARTGEDRSGSPGLSPLPAETASRITSEFLYNMSHELRTPLNAIIGFSQVIAGEMLGPVGTPKYSGYARDILDSAERLLGIVNDFLDVSRLEAGTLELTEEAIDVAAAAADLLKTVQMRAEAASIRISVAQDGALPRLRGDARKLRQIVLNLVTNAIKFSRPGGTVEVGLGTVGGGILISVADHGIGMDAEEVQLAAARFGQVATPWARRHDGTGLGLPLAIGLAELHGAKVAIRSAKAVGTTVTVTFPRERSEAISADRTAAAGLSA